MNVITARDGACLISNQMCKIGVTGLHDQTRREEHSESDWGMHRTANAANILYHDIIKCFYTFQVFCGFMGRKKKHKEQRQLLNFSPLKQSLASLLKSVITHLKPHFRHW